MRLQVGGAGDSVRGESEATTMPVAIPSKTLSSDGRQEGDHTGLECRQLLCEVSETEVALFGAVHKFPFVTLRYTMKSSST